jgi:hypothetical protein
MRQVRKRRWPRGSPSVVQGSNQLMWNDLIINIAVIAVSDINNQPGEREVFFSRKYSLYNNLQRLTMRLSLTIVAVSACLVSLCLFTGLQLRQSSESQRKPTPLEPHTKRSVVMLSRLQAAETILKRKLASKQVTSTHCDEPVLKHSRPGAHTEQVSGQDCEAWLTRPAIQVLDVLLVEPLSLNGLEWGSGSSSMWAVTRLRSLISVEHDQRWFQLVEKFFESDVGSNLIAGDDNDTESLRWRGVLFRPETQGEEAFLGRDGRYHKKYVKDTAKFTPLGANIGAKFDYILVDGRARASCIKNAIKMLKADGGILILDNSERPEYSRGIDLVPSYWIRRDYLADVPGGFQTTIWISVDGFN